MKNLQLALAKRCMDFKQGKSARTSCIPVKHLIKSVDICLLILTYIISHPFQNGIFLEELKFAEMTPFNPERKL